jgi:hypothetical protein
MPVEHEPAVGQYLRMCTDRYESLVERTARLARKGSPEAVLNWIEMTAAFAAMHHPGRFADGAIENVALEVGRDLPRPLKRTCEPLWLTDPERRTPARRRVLHVTTFVSAVGGHTRIILNWIRQDPGSRHSVVLTRQGDEEVPSALAEAATASGGQLVILPVSAPIVERARWLRGFAVETADLVILHNIPNDIVPVVAFAVGGGGPPVGLVNLADQCFWVGSGIADVVVNLREVSIATSREVRFTRNDRLLPVPLPAPDAALTRREARRRLGIPESEQVLLTVGRSVKYIPSCRQNFFRTAGAILDRNPAARLYLVGVREADHAASPGFVRHARMHFVGQIDDATSYQCAADVYLEGFPFGSQAALLESVLAGVPCVRVFAPASPVLAADDIALTGVVDNPVDEEDYIARAGEFISDLDGRQQVGTVLRERVLRYHVSTDWNLALDEVYRTLAQRRHKPVTVPSTTGSARPIDLAISEYHATRFLGQPLPGALDRELVESIGGVAYCLRERGFYYDSFRVVRMARPAWWREPALVMFAGKLLPHRILAGRASRAAPRRTDDSAPEASRAPNRR